VRHTGWHVGTHRRGLRRVFRLAACLIASSAACGDDRTSDGVRIADVESPVASRTAAPPPPTNGAAGTDTRGLALAAGGVDGQQYTVARVEAGGMITGRIGGPAPRDTLIAPTHDTRACAPFREPLVSGARGGVGQVVVWLEGVSRGPRIEAPRTVTLTYDRCRLAPRVQRVGIGGTVMVKGRDALFARLKFMEEGGTTARETVFLTDAGQVVPSSAAAATPGLVHVRDDKHPWVHAWLVVAPHPFVAITEDDGAFRFEGVPAGTYRLVAWHERLGVKRQRVRVDGSVEAKVALQY